MKILSPDEWLFGGSRYILISIQSLSISLLSLWYFAGRGSPCPHRVFNPSLVPIDPGPAFLFARRNYVNYHKYKYVHVHMPGSKFHNWSDLRSRMLIRIFYKCARCLQNILLVNGFARVCNNYIKKIFSFYLNKNILT